MNKNQLNNLLLKRYWFNIKDSYGVEITAFSLADANFFLDELSQNMSEGFEILEIIEDINIQTLDQGHVTPNMKSPNFRDIWFPNVNI